MRTRTSVAATLSLLAAAYFVQALKYAPQPTAAQLVMLQRPEPGTIEDGPLGDTTLFFYKGPVPINWQWWRHMPFRGRGPLWPIGRAPRTRGGVQA